MRYIYFLLFFAVFISCDKEEPPIDNPGDGSSFETSKPYSGPITDISEADTNCFHIPSSATFPTPNYDSILLINPCLNYNNDNEFIYVEYNTITNEKKLIKYNLLSQQKYVLLNNSTINTQPYWKNNQIVYVNENFNIEVLNDDGSNLQSIVHSGSAHYAIFDNNNNHVLWTENTSGQIINTKSTNVQTGETEIYNTSIRQWLGNYHTLDYKPEGQILNTNEVSIIKITTKNSSSVPLLNYTDYFGQGGVVDLIWARFEDGVIYFSSIDYSENLPDGVFKLDMINGSLTKLFKHCSSVRYRNITISSNDEFLIAEKVEKDSIFDNQENFTGEYLTSSSIYKIDLNTLEETKINL